MTLTRILDALLVGVLGGTTNAWPAFVVLCAVLLTAHILLDSFTHAIKDDML